MASSEGFGCRIWYSVLDVCTMYWWQSTAVDDFFPLFLVPQLDGLHRNNRSRRGFIGGDAHGSAKKCDYNCDTSRLHALSFPRISPPARAESAEASLPVADRSSFERAGRFERTSQCSWPIAPSERWECI